MTQKIPVAPGLRQKVFSRDPGIGIYTLHVIFTLP